MNALEKLNQVKAFLGMETKVELESMKLENGAVLEAEAFEAGKEVFVVAEGEKVPVPAGEYSLEDGKVLVVAEDGIIGEIKEAKAEEDPKEDEAKDAAEKEQELENEETPATPKKVVESISKELFFEKIEAMQAEIDALKLSLQTKEEEVKEEVKEEPKVELSAEEEVKPFKHNPETKAPKVHTQGTDTKLSKIFNIISK